MKAKILKIDEVIFDGEIQSAEVPGKQGNFQILKNHAPILSTLNYGVINLQCDPSNQNNKNFSYKIKGGILNFSDNDLLILCS